MSRLEEVVGIYEEMDKITERELKDNGDNIELAKSLIMASIMQSLKNIDITLAILLDEKGAGHESS